MVSSPESVTTKTLVPGSLASLLGIHLLALAAPFTFSWTGFTLFLVMVIATGMLGITLGYHRLLTHQSFETPGGFKVLVAVLGCLAMQVGPLRWVATHRLHHKTADTVEDPHSPMHVFWWTHLVWNLYRHPKLDNLEGLKHLAPDLYRDPIFRFLDRYFVLLNLGFTCFYVGYCLKGGSSVECDRKGLCCKAGPKTSIKSIIYLFTFANQIGEYPAKNFLGR